MSAWGPVLASNSSHVATPSATPPVRGSPLPAELHHCLQRETALPPPPARSYRWDGSTAALIPVSNTGSRLQKGAPPRGASLRARWHRGRRSGAEPR